LHARDVTIWHCERPIAANRQDFEDRSRNVHGQTQSIASGDLHGTVAIGPPWMSNQTAQEKGDRAVETKK
jgi:hypothetical protein